MGYNSLRNPNGIIMRVVTSLCLLFLLVSCFNENRSQDQIDQLNVRINQLEQRIDSFANVQGVNVMGTTTNQRPTSIKLVRQTERCQAVTKKGTQCKRTASASGYCWQHG